MNHESRFEFPLAQGWSKGLRLAFESPSTLSQMPAKRLRVKQVHGNHLVVATPSMLSRESVEQTLEVDADGFMAQGDWFKDSGTALVVATADCCPLIYVDRLKQSVAIVYAGWRGLQKGIHLKPFESGLFDPISTWVWLGPCLEGSSFEVRQDMVTQFDASAQKDTEIFLKHATQSDKKLFSPLKFLEKAFEKLAVELFYNVEIDTLSSNHFASYRRVQGDKAQLKSNFSWVGFC